MKSDSEPLHDAMTESPSGGRRMEPVPPVFGQRMTVRSVLRPILIGIALLLITVCRMVVPSDQIAISTTWLLVALLALAGWFFSPVLAVSATLISLVVWSRVESVAVEEWNQLLPGQLLRLVVALWLVTWIGRLRRHLAQANRLARLDSLTGLPNRQALVEALEAELSRTRRTGRPFTVALLDCDGFKGINDRDGHLAGDEVLRRIGVALRQHTRRYDCVGRLGGDEFLLVLSEVDADEALLIIERLRAALRHFVEREYPMLTFSLGIVTFQTAEFDWEECVRLADEAMYAAKKQGTDQTRFEVVNVPVTRTLPIPK